MRDAPPALDAALAGTHQVRSALQVYRLADDAPVGTVPVTAGTVRQNLTDPLGWDADLTLADPAWVPQGTADALSGFAGTYVRVMLGALTGSGPSLIHLVDLLPNGAQVDRTAGSADARVSLVTAAAWADTAWDAPLAALPGETVQQAIVRIVSAAVPHTLQVSDTTTPVPLDPRWTSDATPWQAARALAEGANLVTECDARTLTIRPPYSIGVPDATWTTTDQIVQVSGEGGRGGGFANRVRVAFDSPDGQVVGDARLTTGPLAYGGPAGRVTARLERPGPADLALAQVLAADLLATTSAAYRTTALQARNDPRLACGDTLRVEYPGGPLDHLVTFTEWDLAGGPMSVGVRTDAATV